MTTNKVTAQVRDVVGVKDSGNTRIDPAKDGTLAKLIATDYKYIDIDLSSSGPNSGVLTNYDPLTADVNIVWVKVMRYDGTDDSLTVKIGTTGKPAIHLNKLTRPDSDVIFDGYVSAGRIFLTQAAAQAGAKFRAIVGVVA